MGRYHTSDGAVVDVDDDYAATLGLTPVSEGEQAQRDVTAGQELLGEERGILGTINAGATSFLSGATLGASDVLLGGVMSDAQRQRLYAEREANPGVSTVGNVAGALAASVVAPESLLGKTPAGYLSRAAGEAVEAGRAAGGLGGLARVAAASGAEAAAQSAGAYLSDVALSDRELSAEGMAAALGRGFAFGAAAGGGLYGIEKGTIAARRLFSRTGSAKAAELAEHEWATQSTRALDATDDAAAQARKLIDESDTHAATQAELDVATGRAPAPVETPTPAVESTPVRAAPEPTPAAPPTPEPTPTPAAREVAEPAPAPRPATEPAPAPKPQTLEDKLVEMQARVNAGETLPSLNAARKAELQDALTEYDAARDWVERVRNPRVEHHGINVEGSTNANAGFGKVRRVFDTDVPVEQSGGQVRIVGAKENTLDSLTPNSRLMGADVVPDRQLGRAMDEEYHDLIDMARRAEVPEDRALLLGEAAGIEKQIHDAARGHRPEVDAVIDRIEALRTEHGRSALTSAEKRLYNLQDRYERAGELHALPKPERQAPIARQPTRKPDVPADALTRPPSFVEEAHEAAQAFTAYEKASAKLVDAMGDAAPQGARDVADGFRKAEADAERKATERTTRAVDDHVEGVKPKKKRGSKAPAGEAPASAPQGAPPLGEAPAGAPASGKPPRPKTDHQLEMERIRKETAEANLKAARARQADAEASTAERTGRRAEAEAAKAKLAAEESAKTAAETIALPDGTPARGGLAGKAADLGAVLEAADTLGIPGMPHPRDIPVIGPLLSLYLKYRGLKAVAGRMTGRVAATGDAKAAAAAVKTKERALVAVDRMLGLVERSAPVARDVAVRAGGRLVDALAEPFHDDADPNAKGSESIQVLAAARARELSQAISDPQSVIRRVRSELHEVADPDLLAAAEQFELRKLQHLHDKAPKEPPSGPLVKREWLPSKAEATKFARRVEVADDPIVALEAVERRTITTEQADTLRTLYPKIFASCQQRLFERSADIQKTVPRDQRFRMSLLFDVPLDRLSEPDTVALLQSSSLAHATTSPAAPTQQPGPPMPSIAGPVDLTALYATPSDRRAARR